MYKVFIENKPIIFQINSQLEGPFKVKEWRGKLADFLAGNLSECVIPIRSETDFWLFFDDHQYIEAAGGLVQRGEAFLFIKRNGFWDIPKGKLDPGETPEIAAVREIEEECGLIAPTIKSHLINTWHTYEHKGKSVLKRTYWYWLNEGSEKVALVPQAEEGITEVVYLSEAEFETVLNQTFLSIVEVIDALKKNK